MRPSMEITWDLARIRYDLENGLYRAEERANAISKYQELEEELVHERYERSGARPVSSLDEYRGCELYHIGLLYQDDDGGKRLVSVGTRFRPAFLWIDEEGYLFYQSFGHQPVPDSTGTLIGVVNVFVKCRRDVRAAIDQAFARIHNQIMM